jgi:hypothetical protein
VTDEDIRRVFNELRPEVKISIFDMLVYRELVKAEKERCAALAEIPGMTPADIARAIRNG